MEKVLEVEDLSFEGNNIKAYIRRLNKYTYAFINKTRDGFYIVVRGNTYKVKDELKRLGFKFSSLPAGWEKDDATEDDVKRIAEIVDFVQTDVDEIVNRVHITPRSLLIRLEEGL